MKTYKLLSHLAVIVACTLPVIGLADEASALKVLASSDASLHDKAMACDELGRVGTAKAVPALATLLADKKLHDYARDGLERIADPVAGKALLDAAKTLKGSLRVGVIISLGDLSEEAAVPMLAKIAKGKDTQAAGAALSALAQIATDDSAKAILAVLADGKGASKTAAAQAVRLAAQQMEQDGRKDAAAKLRKALD